MKAPGTANSTTFLPLVSSVIGTSLMPSAVSCLRLAAGSSIAHLDGHGAPRRPFASAGPLGAPESGMASGGGATSRPTEFQGAAIIMIAALAGAADGLIVQYAHPEHPSQSSLRGQLLVAMPQMRTRALPAPSCICAPTPPTVPWGLVVNRLIDSLSFESLLASSGSRQGVRGRHAGAFRRAG